MEEWKDITLWIERFLYAKDRPTADSKPGNRFGNTWAASVNPKNEGRGKKFPRRRPRANSKCGPGGDV